MGLKGEKRAAMYELPPYRKKYLLQQNQLFRAATPQRSPPKSQGHGFQPSYSASYGPSSAVTLMPRLVPQLTGDAGILRRFSVAGWGAGSTAPPIVSVGSDRSSGEFNTSGSSAQGKDKGQVEKIVEDLQPLQPQTTGGIWGSWWTSSGGEKPTTNVKEAEKSIKWYVDGVRAGSTTDIKLVKHLISLRVHLSTTKLVRIEEFVEEEKGLEALGNLLASLTGKGGKRRNLNEMEITVLLEVTKCLRVLLNTEVSPSRPD